MFLDESLETADRERLTAHQLGRLREGLRHVLDKNPFYSARLRDAGLESSHELRSLEDLARLPFTTKQELVQDQTANPPFGTNLSEPLEAYVRLFQTSGTTGRPLRWLHARFGHCHGRRSYPAWFPVFALDRIWVHPKASLLQFEVRDTPETRMASDHLPVRAELSLAEPESGVRHPARVGECEIV